jgi:glyoxylase I family protein
VLVGFEHIGMSVSDLDRSIAFYRDLLGLTVKLRKAQRNGGEVAFLDAAGGQLELSQAPGVTAAATDLAPGAAGLRHLTFSVDDVDATFGRLLAAGVTPMEPPRDAFNVEMLTRLAFVRDPDGIAVELVQRHPARG